MTTSVKVSFFFGIVVRRSALKERGIDLSRVLSLLETQAPYDAGADLLSFGPHFGPEARDTFVRRLQEIGLEYFDDFVDLELDHPEWLGFRAELTKP